MELLETADSRLRAVLRALERHWFDPRVGIVGAGVFAPSGNSAIATSIDHGAGRWVHAERETIGRFESEFSTVMPGSSIVVTLSPCARTHSKNRIGGPCLELLAERRINYAHVGIVDPLDAEILDRRAAELGIHLTVSTDSICRLLCKRLVGIFGRYRDRVNWDLPAIKQEVGLAVFSPSQPCDLDLIGKVAE